MQRLAVLHHRFDGVRAIGAGEAFVLRLLATDDRDRHHVFDDAAIHLQRPHRLFHRVRFIGVGGVALLPEKLGGAQEHARPHFPAHDIRPLVQLQRQVAIRFDPTTERIANDRLGRRAQDQRLGQLSIRIRLQRAVHLFQAMVSDDSHLFGEAVDVLSFLREKAERDHHREVIIVVTSSANARVHLGDKALPDAHAPGLDDHAAARRRQFSEVSLANDRLVPFGKIFRARDLKRMHGRDRFLFENLGINCCAPRRNAT